MSPSPDRNIPDFFPTRFSGRAVHFQDNDVVFAFGVLMNRVLLSRRRAVAEVPFPGIHFASGVIPKCYDAAVRVYHPERPIGLELEKLRLERHQPESDELIGLPEHSVLSGEVPECVLLT